MNEPLRIALAGLGTVGAGVVELLRANAKLIERRAGRALDVVAVSARDRSRNRGVDLSGADWCDDPLALAGRDDVDCVVELIGGSEGPALALASAALASGKSFVTANKAMIAHHGMELARAAETNALALRYEAAVAGGIPVIKGLRDGASANDIARVYGILNGTCNYILSEMEQRLERRQPADFAAVLADAQALGFAEADPGFDIDGVDAAHKLSIIAALSFGHAIDFGGVATTGIRNVMAADIGQARALGYCIRLLGMARREGTTLVQRVDPYLVPVDHPLAAIDGPTNAVVAEGNFVGRLLFQGAGAGAGPTASAVVADLIDIARGDTGPVFAAPTSEMEPARRAESGTRFGKSYVRFLVEDQPGVLAEITAAMRDAKVSIESLLQTEKTADGEVLISLVTHECSERDVHRALDGLAPASAMRAAPVVMHLLGESD